MSKWLQNSLYLFCESFEQRLESIIKPHEAFIVCVEVNPDFLLNLFGTERPFKVNRQKNVFFQITSAVGVDRSFQSYQEVPWMFLHTSDILRE